MYQSHIYSPFKIYFTPIKGQHGPLCILAIPCNSGAARICQRGPEQGSEVTEIFTSREKYDKLFKKFLRETILKWVNFVIS